MARSGESRGRGGRPSGPRPAGAARKPRPTPSPRPGPPPAHPFAPSGRFVLGAVAGATPGRWVDAWRERHPQTPIDLEPVDPRAPRAGLDDGTQDAALLRLPLDRAGLSVIVLYDEQSVVVAAAESHLAAADELELSDLAGEIVIVPGDDVLAMGAVPGAVAPAFAPPATTELAIETVAAGVGVVVVPMSLARLHRRRDVEVRPLRDGPVSTVALAWPSAATTPAVEAFVGIVRGRTAHSSRS